MKIKIFLLVATLILSSCGANVSEENGDSVNVSNEGVNIQSGEDSITVGVDGVDVNITGGLDNIEDEYGNDIETEIEVEAKTSESSGNLKVDVPGVNVEIDGDSMDVKSGDSSVKMDDSGIKVDTRAARLQMDDDI
ncbi:MAG: hypothetical protein PHS49_03060 [Candidatus Gracilibacteria bacterium]|nr:hypothetical protein [Candidatus Gracilibacteria bacterium]